MVIHGVLFRTFNSKEHLRGLLKHRIVINPEIFDDIRLRVYSNSPSSRYSFIP